MRFTEIPGMIEEKDALIQSVERNHLSHALMFSGPEGNASFSLAMAFSAYINCEQLVGHDSCGKCSSCIKIDKLVHPDVQYVFPVAATGGIKGKDVVSASYMKEWREFALNNPYGTLSDWNRFFGAENKQSIISKEESRQIIKSLSLKAYEGNYKILIVWQPEWMHPASANALLKIIEEPPPKTVFIFITYDEEKILPTIQSRVQVIKIRGFTDQEISSVLEEKYGLPPEKAFQLAHLADGNLKEAEKHIDNVEEDNHVLFRDWMRACFKKDLVALIEWSENFQKMSKIAQKSLLRYGLNIFRETLVYAYADEKLNRLEGKDIDFVSNFSSVVGGDKIEEITALFNKSYYHLERNANPRILMMDISISMSKMFSR